MEEAGLAMRMTTGHLSSMYTTLGNYRDVTVALIFFEASETLERPLAGDSTRRIPFSVPFSLYGSIIYIYIFYKYTQV